MKKIISAIGILTSTASVLFAQTTKTEPFRNTKLPVEQRIENLLGLLTVDEKIGMMMDNSKAVSRLGIPAYGWWNEALHGVARAGTATVFPQAIGLAASWDVPEHLKTFEMISDEARAKYNRSFDEAGKTGRYEGLTFWTPNINIFRDPRWGRGQETYGEDPFLTASLGVAAVKGLQGNDPDYFKTHACAKHFAVHSGPEWNRHSYNAEISHRDLYETYLPAFKALVIEGNVREVMCAYNAFDGQPCCANDFLVSDILRGKWKYDGMVVSDCWALADFYQKKYHGTHPDEKSTAADALKHSTDLECGDTYNNLNKSLASGLITEKDIDASMRRILKGWFELGMLDPKSSVHWNSIPYTVVDSEEHKQQALKMAQKSIVLMKNDKNVLPLNKNIKKIAVLGPNADDGLMQLGNYNGTPSSIVTILDGIRNKFPNAEVIYEKGSEVTDPSSRTSLYQNFLSQEKGEKGMKVEFFNNNEFKGSPANISVNKTGISYNSFGGTQLAPNVGRENTAAKISGIFKSTYTGDVIFSASTSDVYKLFVDGKEVATRKGPDARHPSEFPVKMEKGKEYNIELQHRQIGKYVSITFDVYRKDPVNFTAVKEKVKDAEVIIFAGGLSPSLEGEEMMVNAEGFKGGDKTNIELPKVQRELLAELRKTGKPVVFVLCTGSALGLEQDEKNYDALLNAWYGGQSSGAAVADVLSGDYNPSGKLPITFYKNIAQLDNALSKTGKHEGFENYDMQGRTYRYMKEQPLYPFGHGLSYASFSYGNATLSKNTIGTNESVTLSVPVTNTSGKNGEEVVEVYIKRNNDPLAPVKTLRAFQRVAIPSKTSKTVRLTLSPDSFMFYDEKADDLVSKPGDYTILYGGTSADSGLKSLPLKVK
ncbi:glycoside hydrolase family 3 C-terminal domain-containing protein [Chryseobacterium sp. SSA4.19]|uniref:glycoside hydrolase family 3 C-terminal domain-containing protein n=1 Tax=Chryseobacterium sp. SSA4.19 TaxID=2919915 RepID=UPI001F4DD04E|nr:glycoside hydrolase family 3 C-terminal domain-containing protein [Chryseobacterium sp. SSA4.19]MCJ8152689.1 glycoside hydrolase family 3 C-terminal domain-containing protein [Chryseobacterium sp. SSA4.19]